jgi:hypothetical protein
VIEFNDHFSGDELAILGSTIGSTWDNYGSSALSDDGRFAFEDCFLQTSSGTLTVSSCLIEYPFPTGKEEITHLSIGAGSDDTRNASRHGLQFFKHKGEVIDSVSIIRATVSVLQEGLLAFSLSSDHGIIFHLTGGVIILTRGSWFLEDILIEDFGALDRPTIDDRSIDWDSELTTQYSVDHAIFNLTELLD